MDDNDDAFDALTQTIEALKLAGVDEDVIAIGISGVPAAREQPAAEAVFRGKRSDLCMGCESPRRLGYPNEMFADEVFVLQAQRLLTRLDKTATSREGDVETMEHMGPADRHGGGTST